ncbi:glycosyltransferase family 4 protein [Aeromonas veronii]
MKNIKIVISANTSWYIYNFRRNTILKLVELGCSVIVLSPKDKFTKKLIDELGVEFYDIKIDQGGVSPIRDILTFISFCKFFSSNNADVSLHFTPKNNIYGTLSAKLFGVKVINNVAGLGILFINESLTSKIAKLLYKISQRFADKIFFQNEDDRKLFLLNGMAKEEVTDRLPGSGADLSRFSVVPAVDDGVTRFLLIARMLYDKGVGHYVEAARILRDKYGSSVEFNLLGFLDVNNPSAVTKDQMQEWVSEGIVNYLGISDSVETEIAKSDCVVLPSFYREGVPKSLLEAGAMGKPIVTTNNVGCRETVDDGVNGFLCEPRSTASLVSQLERIITMGHQSRISMGMLSRQKIENEFDEKIVIAKYLEAIKTVL